MKHSSISRSAPRPWNLLRSLLCGTRQIIAVSYRMQSVGRATSTRPLYTPLAEDEWLFALSPTLTVLLQVKKSTNQKNQNPCLDISLACLSMSTPECLTQHAEVELRLEQRNHSVLTMLSDST